MQFLTDKIPEFANADYLKKILSYHSSFDIVSFFKGLDANNNGVVTADEFAKYFAQNEVFKEIDWN